jgi:5-formyltetrahydrofolate cyclo-ligase
MVEKRAARNLMLGKRRSLSEILIKKYSLKIAQTAYDYVIANSFKNVAIYMSIRNEVRMEYLIELNKSKKFDIFLPVCQKEDNIYFNKLEDSDFMEKDYFGISCPKNGKTISEKEIEVFFIPGLAFDVFGNRVGYGKGCFDRILGNTGESVFVGVSYEFQVIYGDALESEASDVAMDFILTEKGMRIADNSQ